MRVLFHNHFKLFKSTFVAVAAGSLMAVSPAHAEQAPLSVASSIKPLDIIVRHIGGIWCHHQSSCRPSQSLHHAGLRPSQRQVIVDSDIVFVLDPLMESSLAKIIDEEDGSGRFYLTV